MVLGQRILMQNMNRARDSLGNIFKTLIILTTIMLINVVLFHVYLNVALYINFLFVAFGMLFYGKINGKSLIYIVIMAIYLVFTLFITGGGFGSVITFMVPLFMLTVFSNLHFSSKSQKTLIIFGVIVILLLYLYSIPYGENYRLYSLTKINPNTLGMFMMLFFMVVCVCGRYDSKRNKLFLMLLLLFSFLGMYNYESRGTTLALCSFVLLLVLPQKMFNPKRFVAFVVAVILIGTTIPFVYLNLYESGYELNIFGKSLYTGRESLWSNMFSLMKDDLLKILFGMGSQTVLWENELNVHNNYFNIIVNFGVVGYVIYYVFILSNIWRASKYINNPTVKKGLIMFICSVLVLGFTETTSLWSVIFPFAYFGLIVANSECMQDSNVKIK